MDRSSLGQVFDGEASVWRYGRGGLAVFQRTVHLVGSGRLVQQKDLAAGDGLAARVDHSASQGGARTQSHDTQIRGAGPGRDPRQEDRGGVSLPAYRDLRLGSRQLREREDASRIALDLRRVVGSRVVRRART
jgi:hypothetical protein